MGLVSVLMSALFIVMVRVYGVVPPLTNAGGEGVKHLSKATPWGVGLERWP